MWDLSRPRNSAQAAVTRILSLALVLVAGAVSPRAESSLTCETRGDIRHCFDDHGHESTEERSGDYVHGHDNQGRAWTTWEHDGRTDTWQTR
jgi:hypothetical protein